MGHQSPAPDRRPHRQQPFPARRAPRSSRACTRFCQDAGRLDRIPPEAAPAPRVHTFGLVATLEGLEGRGLVVGQPNRVPFMQPYRSTVRSLRRERNLTCEQLIAEGTTARAATRRRPRSRPCPAMPCPEVRAPARAPAPPPVPRPPSVASPTTSYPSASSNARANERKPAWSSTIKTVPATGEIAARDAPARIRGSRAPRLSPRSAVAEQGQRYPRSRDRCCDSIPGVPWLPQHSVGRAAASSQERVRQPLNLLENRLLSPSQRRLVLLTSRRSSYPS